MGQLTMMEARETILVTRSRSGELPDDVCDKRYERSPNDLEDLLVDLSGEANGCSGGTRAGECQE
jgi:hypothetical protein